MDRLAADDPLVPFLHQMDLRQPPGEGDLPVLELLVGHLAGVRQRVHVDVEAALIEHCLQMTGRLDLLPTRVDAAPPPVEAEDGVVGVIVVFLQVPEKGQRRLPRGRAIDHRWLCGGGGRSQDRRAGDHGREEQATKKTGVHGAGA